MIKLLNTPKKRVLKAETSYPSDAIDDNCRFDPAKIVAKVTGFVDIKSKDENALQYHSVLVVVYGTDFDKDYWLVKNV
jgi:hypothetical protein